MKKLFLLLIVIIMSVTSYSMDFNQPSKATSYLVFKSEFVNMNMIYHGRKFHLDDNDYVMIFTNISLGTLCYLTYKNNPQLVKKTIIMFSITDMIIIGMLITKKITNK
jgi:hypothetical protein